MGQTLALAAALTFFWVVLSGYWLPLIVFLGIASILLVLVISRRLDVCDREGHPVHVALRGFGYFPWLAKEIVVSNLIAAKAIVTGTARPQVLRVKAHQSDDLGKTVYANSITMTPGTVSLDVSDDYITVHALTNVTAEGVKSGEMNDRICRLMGDPVPAGHGDGAAP